jgi:deazaflavin-dependent oxidoreductase (nitroreductase family)
MVAATNFGGPQPAWALNLQADPCATFERDGHTYRVRARPAAVEEAEAAWPIFEDAWPAFAAYRRRAGRDIEVFVLDPLEDGAAPQGGFSPT